MFPSETHVLSNKVLVYNDFIDLQLTIIKTTFE